jgi:hypothetical protein
LVISDDLHDHVGPVVDGQAWLSRDHEIRSNCMIDKVMLWLDEYERPARLVPGLLAIAPIAFALIGVGLRNDPLLAGVLAVLIAVGAPLVVVKYVRERGLSAEGRLYREWGGAPTTLLLRPSGGHPVGPVKEQRRTNVERVTGVSLPTEPTSADDLSDETYEAAVRSLRKKTSDHGAFPLVFVENKNYGFERNCRGIRPEGIAISLLCLGTLCVSLILAARGTIELSVPALAVVGVINLVLLSFWVLWPTKDRVKRSGTRYAERLLDACVDL